METGHRYRLLIYFAALVLCLSVCFAYAETPASLPAPLSVPCSLAAATPTTTNQPVHLLFNAAPGRSSFLPPLSASLISEPASEQPVMTADAVLQGLTLQSNHSHSLLHGMFPRKQKLKLVKTHAAEHLSAAVNASPEMTDEQAAR